MSWFFEDETVEWAERVQQSLSQGCEAIVPAIWWLEVANAALSGERRGRTTKVKVDSFIHSLAKLPILSDYSSAANLKTLELARQYKLSAYDASYLELTLRLGADLASLDQPLLLAAQSAGVKRFEPNS